MFCPFFRVLGARFRFSGPEFQVTGLGLRDSDLGLLGFTTNPVGGEG